MTPDALHAQQLLLRAQHILLLTDERIDGDTIGASLGLFHSLQTLGKEVHIFSPKPLDPKLNYLPGVESINRDVSTLATHQQTEVIVVCDAAEGDYLPNLLKLLPSVPLISFDHHASNPRYGTLNLVEPLAASTADVVWRFLKLARFPIPKNTARCLLTGICTDTSLFSTSNTTTDALQAAADLIKHGGNLREIIRHNFMNRSLATLRLWGRAMERLFQDDLTKGLATIITLKDLQELKVDDHDLQGISNFLNAMLSDEYDVVAVYRELPGGGLKCSLRSRLTDVAALAKSLSPQGGGHRLASGFKLPRAKALQENGRWLIKK